LNRNTASLDSDRPTQRRLFYFSRIDKLAGSSSLNTVPVFSLVVRLDSCDQPPHQRSFSGTVQRWQCGMRCSVITLGLRSRRRLVYSCNTVAISILYILVFLLNEQTLRYFVTPYSFSRMSRVWSEEFRSMPHYWPIIVYKVHYINYPFLNGTDSYCVTCIFIILAFVKVINFYIKVYSKMVWVIQILLYLNFTILAFVARRLDYITWQPRAIFMVEGSDLQCSDTISFGDSRHFRESQCFYLQGSWSPFPWSQMHHDPSKC
jgi:hypothetical protein